MLLSSSTHGRLLTPVALLAAGALCLGALSACASDDKGGDAGPTSGAPASGGPTGAPIVLGNVVDLTGPIPGLFKAAREGTEAALAKANAEGGIDGRPLRLETADSQTTCNGASAAYEGLVPKVEAFVGSLSGLDGCIIPVLTKNPTIPAVGYQLDPRLSGVASAISPAPRPPGAATGAYKYLSDKNPGAIEHLGELVNTQTAFSNKQLNVALAKLGGTFVSSRELNVTKTTDYTSDIIRMKKAGVRWLTLDGLPIPTIAQVLAAAQQQGFKPDVITAAPAYDGNFLSLADPAAAEGVYLPMAWSMFLGEDEASSPGVADYRSWLEKTSPGAKPDLFGMYAWAATQLYVQARKAAGKDATPPQVGAALNGIHQFDAGLLLPPGADPGARTPSTCYVLAQIKDGAYVRVNPADKGFACEDSEYVPLPLS